MPWEAQKRGQLASLGDLKKGFEEVTFRIRLIRLIERRGINQVNWEKENVSPEYSVVSSSPSCL